MIKINRNSNFHITFPNHVTVSILISNGSYSDNHDNWDIGEEINTKNMISTTAEIAAWREKGEWITRELRPDANEDVLGWQAPEQILDFLNKASKYRGYSANSEERVNGHTK